MARIIHPTDNVDLSPFDEPVFDTPEAESGTPGLQGGPELLTPEVLRRRAGEEAETILQTARTQAEQIRVVAEAEGRAAGEIAGRTQALEEHRAAVEVLTALAQAIRDDNARTREELTRYVTEVALAIVRRVLGDLADANPEVMHHVVGEALRALGARAVVTVRVHPSMVPVVQHERETLLEAYEDTKELHILGDPAVAPGGCLLETPQVSIDATVEQVIATLRDELLDAPPAVGAAPLHEPSDAPRPVPRPTGQAPDTEQGSED